MNLIKLEYFFFCYLTVFIEVIVGESTDDTVETSPEYLKEIESNEVTPINSTAKLNVNDYWMARAGVISNDLINIQAVIVKDEDADTCLQGIQKSTKRYMMCAGSILTKNRILTSASCLHEALHIRHNVRAPLAVVIAPLKPTVQIIRVTEYRIHPNHNTNPYSTNYSKHNIAILSLACKIEQANYFKIELPKESVGSICRDEDCVVAIYKSTSYTSHVMLQTLAPQIPSVYRKRRQVDSELMKFKKIVETVKRLVKRSTDGSHSCAQTGAAVMRNNTQAAIVAVSCDDRQAEAKWEYTDIYNNEEWIHNILNDWNQTNSNGIPQTSGKNGTMTSGLPNKNCGNCVFNFYITVGCKEKGTCPDQNKTEQVPTGSTWNTEVNNAQKPLRRFMPTVDSTYRTRDPFNRRVSRFDNDSVQEEFSKIDTDDTELIDITTMSPWMRKKLESISKYKIIKVPKRIESNEELSNLLKRRQIYSTIQDKKINRKIQH